MTRPALVGLDSSQIKCQVWFHCLSRAVAFACCVCVCVALAAIVHWQLSFCQLCTFVQGLLFLELFYSLWSHSGVLWTQKWRSSLLRTQSWHDFPFKPGVGQNTALPTARNSFAGKSLSAKYYSKVVWTGITQRELGTNDLGTVWY